MYAKNINFGNESCDNFTSVKPLPKELEENLMSFEILNNEIYLSHENNPIRLYGNSSFQENTVEQIKTYKDQTLLRVDKISGKNIYLSIYIFPRVINFENNENFTITIDQATELELKRQNIQGNILQFFNNQFMLDDKCFALISDKDLDIITLIGNNYFCKIKRSNQNYLHVIGLRPRRTNQQVLGEVTLLKGNISFVDTLSDKSQLTYETNKKYQNSIKDTHSLLKLWSLYNELELESSKQEINEMGFIKYHSYSIVACSNNKDKLVFLLDKKVKMEFLKSSMGYVVVDEDGFDEDEPTSSNKYIFIGDEIEVSDDRKEFSIYCRGEIDELPKKGYIMGAFQGSLIMSKRRKEAQSKIEGCRTPLVNLKLLLQTGEGSEVSGKKYSPVNDELLKKIFGDKSLKFTERQREAIDIAINTPDIVIIQGPPGTGKTTVIRAIIARLGMIYDGNVKILVSSAQHDAVDNAIENVEYGGLPVNRLGGKFGASDNKSDKYIWKWLDELNNKCEEFIAGETISDERSAFRKIYLKIESCRKNMSQQEIVKNELIDIHATLLSTNLDKELAKMVYIVLQRLTITKVESYTTDTDVIILPELKKLIDSQRVDKISFLDDGRMQISKLIRFLMLNDEIKFDIPEVWGKLRRITSEDDVENLDFLLNEFKLSLDGLTNIVFGEDIQSYQEEMLYQKDVNDLFDKIIDSIQKYGENSKDRIKDVIWDFKDQLDNPQNIRELIEKYTKINAATCQQAVSKKLGDFRVNGTKEYDYVIIDEAARANPLDLLIPMSMGKKIILVGDHNQLPHLLEKDIVEKVVEAKNDKEVEELLKESLFSRLYSLLDKSKYTGIKRTVMLREQYRMHPTIGQLVSGFYKEELISASSIEQKIHNLDLYNNKPIAWINVPKEKGTETSINNQSKYREAEKDRVMQELYKILKANDKYSIGIITFYKKQSILIQEEVNKLSFQDQKRIWVGTVDAFQGKEFDITILSTVRSNSYKDKRKRVGFLDSRNRLCVAFSRGKRLLLGIGDFETVAQDADNCYVEELKDFYELCRREGYYE